jgi:polyhydroxyalkanoate synthesis regulator phasin
MTDFELQQEQCEQKHDERFKVLESQLAAKVEELATQLAAQRTRIADLESLGGRVEALEKQLAKLQTKK